MERLSTADYKTTPGLFHGHTSDTNGEYTTLDLVGEEYALLGEEEHSFFRQKSTETTAHSWGHCHELQCLHAGDSLC